jgi:hypothetical protein
MSPRSIVLLCFLSSTGASRLHARGQLDLKREKPKRFDEVASKKVIDLSSKDDHFRKMHAHRIPCPMIASFYRMGWLNPDKYGRVESAEMYSSLRKSGTSKMSAFFQSSGIVAYNFTDYDQTQRNRKPSFWMIWGNQAIEDRRYVNLFRMNPGDFVNSPQVQHGISTTIRDGRYDHMAKPLGVKEGEGLILTGGTEAADKQEEYDRVRKLRQERFDKWIDAEGVLDSQGRMYAEGLGKLVVNMKREGDRSGEFSFDPSSSEIQNVDKYHPKAGEQNGEEVKEPLSEWQASLAWIGTLVGFGQNTTSGLGGEYLTRDDLVSLFLDSELPKNWERISWGFKPSDINVLIDWEENKPSFKFPPAVMDKPYYRDLYFTPSIRIGQHYLETFTRLGMFNDPPQWKN